MYHGFTYPMKIPVNDENISVYYFVIFLIQFGAPEFAKDWISSDRELWSSEGAWRKIKLKKCSCVWFHSFGHGS